MDAKKNFAVSRVATAPSPATSGTSLVVTAGQGTRFPATPFNAVVCPVDADPVPENAEVVRVTNRATDTLTITRATESSTARSVIVGDRIYAGPTALSFTDIEGNHAVTGSITTIQPDDAAAAGSDTTWARGNHTHAVVAASPVGVASWTTAASAEGSATSFARSDHAHGMPWTNTALTQVQNVQYSSAIADTATGVANTWYAVRVAVLGTQTITGVEIRNGGTTSGNLRAALFNSIGVKVADRTSDLAQAGAINTNRRIPFDSTYDAASGTYYCLIWFSSATAKAFMATVHGIQCFTGTNATTTPTAIGSAVANTVAPVMSIY